MASAQPEEILRAGVTEWNTWRKKQSKQVSSLVRAECNGLQLPAVNLQAIELVYCSFKGADLSGANLSHCTFRKSNSFQGAVLDGADLQQSRVDFPDQQYRLDLSKASLKGADLRGAELSGRSFLDGAVLDEATLSGGCFDYASCIGMGGTDVVGEKASFQFANLSKVVLRRATLRGASFAHADLTGCNLQDADLTSADLNSARIARANLSGINLTSANLPAADWRDVDARRANLTAARVGGQLEGVDFQSAQLDEITIADCTLSKVNCNRARLHGAHLSELDLRGVTFAEADLSGADLRQVDLRGVDLTGAILRGACLERADLTGADLGRADLSNADLSQAMLVDANLANATLNGARVYGTSIWNVDLTETRQTDLIISEHAAPVVTVDRLEMAQFIYLLLNNQTIRGVIDVLTSKVVLILGRFSAKQKPVLDAIRKELRTRNLVPILFDFEVPANKDVTGTIETLARMARFIIADLSDPRSVPHELATIVPLLRTTPVLPLVREGSRAYTMFVDLQRSYRWVMAPHRYPDAETLIAQLPALIEPADKKARELHRALNEHD